MVESKKWAKFEGLIECEKSRINAEEPRLNELKWTLWFCGNYIGDF